MNTALVLVFVIAMVDGRPAVENRLADECPNKSAFVINTRAGKITGCLKLKPMTGGKP